MFASTSAGLLKYRHIVHSLPIVDAGLQPPCSHFMRAVVGLEGHISFLHFEPQVSLLAAGCAPEVPLCILSRPTTGAQ